MNKTSKNIHGQSALCIHSIQPTVDSLVGKKKTPESSQKQNLNLPRGVYLHGIYTVFITIYIVFRNISNLEMI